jgi:hypothetical protein
MSSAMAVTSAAAVVLAGAAYVATDPDDPPPPQASLAAAPERVETPTTVRAEPRAQREKPQPPAVQRSKVYVDVYNNSNVTGLAGRTAERIGSAGWQVVGSDNWYGTIPATTIYFPARLERAARLLSKDLGIQRVLPAVDPMSMDRLTVILTADFG